MYTQQQGTQKGPIAAAVLAIIAGVIGLVLSILNLIGTVWIMSLFETEYYGYDFTGLVVIALGLSIWILIASILVLYGGKAAYSRPAEHTKWGIVILLFSIIGLGLYFLSIGTDWTGILGSIAAIMGIIGGILALAFKPAPAPSQPYQQSYAQTGYPPPPQAGYQQPYAQQQPIKRICPNCGRVVDETLRFCPNCGKSLA
jgi:hypothetical protein